MKTWVQVFNKQVEPRCIKQENGCWEFTGGLDHGYGRIRVCPPGEAKFNEYVHRVSYFAHFGSKIGALQVQHKCNNRKCCNPAHLELGDHKKNADYMVASGRYNSPILSESGCRGVSAQRDKGYEYWIARAYIGGTQQLYRGKDFFEACCARKSWEAKHQ